MHKVKHIPHNIFQKVEDFEG